jgi:hypothetical protein
VSDAIEHWDTALDALEARLRSQAAFLAGDGPYPEGSWSPPQGPLPEACRARATLLLTQSNELEGESVARRPRVAVSATPSPYR